MFEITVEKYALMSILRFKGDMLIEDAVMLEDEMEDIIIHSEAKDVALDLIDIDKIDSTGLGAIVRAQATGRVNGKRLMLYRPNAIFMNILEDLELTGFFPMLEDNDDLMGRFI